MASGPSPTQLSPADCRLGSDKDTQAADIDIAGKQAADLDTNRPEPTQLPVLAFGSRL